MRKRRLVAPIKSITSPRRCQLVTCISALSKSVSRVSRSGEHCTESALVGVIVMVSAATLAEPLRLAHQRLKAAVPFSWISIIGMRLEPGSGRESKKSALPNGKVSLAVAVRIGTASNPSKKQQAEYQRSWSIFVSREEASGSAERTGRGRVREYG